MHTSMALVARDPPASSLGPNQRAALSCVAYDPEVPPPIHYDPSIVAGIVFCVAFGLLLVVHSYQFIAKRRWWYSSFAIGALGELIGWAGRARLHDCPYNKTFYTLQIAILIISPCFYTAGIYYILGDLIRLWGRSYSWISPRMYLITFISADLVSIIDQGVGGGIASGSNPDLGAHIMLAGIIVQLISMTAFVVIGAATIAKARKLSWGPKVRAVIFATMFSTICIVTRNLYRAVELGQGWNGYLISHEIYFCILDGMLMVFAPAVFCFFHPAWFLESETTRIVEKEVDSESQDA